MRHLNDMRCRPHGHRPHCRDDCRAFALEPIVSSARPTAIRANRSPLWSRCADCRGCGQCLVQAQRTVSFPALFLMPVMLMLMLMGSLAWHGMQASCDLTCPPALSGCLLLSAGISFGTGTASDKLLSTFLASVSCFPLSTICWAPTAESTACSVLARAGSFLPASLVLEDRVAGPARLIGCLGVAHVVPGGRVPAMQLIVYLDGAICADELGYGHLLRQGLCAEDVSALHQALGAACSFQHHHLPTLCKTSSVEDSVHSSPCRTSAIQGSSVLVVLTATTRNECSAA